MEQPNAARDDPCAEVGSQRGVVLEQAKFVSPRRYVTKNCSHTRRRMATNVHTDLR